MRAVAHLKLKPKYIADRLDMSLSDLRSLYNHVSDHVTELTLVDPRKPGKDRPVINISGDLRLFQSRFYKRILLNQFEPSKYSHGGIPDRSIASNASKHLDSTFGYTADVFDFFPSIPHQRVYKLFRHGFLCDPEASRICTRLCTFDHHLALGLITSPMLADALMRPIDDRINAICESASLVYSRYVDDITISGAFKLLQKSSLIRAIEAVLNRSKLRVHKQVFGRFDRGLTITNLQIKNGRLDVGERFVTELQMQMNDANRIGEGEYPRGWYYMEQQVMGRLQFAKWVNPERGPTLMKSFALIDWPAVHENAQRMGLVKCVTKVVRR